MTDLEGFWGSIWDFFEIRAHVPYERVLGSSALPGAEWFPGARLNYAEHMLGRDEDLDMVAVVAHSQSRDPLELTFGELRDQVARARAGLQRLGVGPGDRVVAYLPNIPETLVAFLATASLGAIWATCPLEFGVRSVVDRLGQLEPTLLLAATGYVCGDKRVDRREQVAEIRAQLPSVRTVVHVPYVGGRDDALPDAIDVGRPARRAGPLEFDPLPFNHPLCVLFSSGTTGLPKAIVHGHGGILIEHLKNHAFSWDLRPGDRLFWFTTTAWMMWNALVSTLLTARVDRDDRRQSQLPGRVAAVAARRGDAARRSSGSARRSRWPAARTGSSRAHLRPLRDPVALRGRLAAPRSRATSGSTSRSARTSSSTSAAAAPTSAPGSCRAIRCCRSTRARCPRRASASTPPPSTPTASRSSASSASS